MDAQIIFLPVLAQILLVIFVYFALGKRKSAAIKSGWKIGPETSLNNKAWPDDVIQASNNIDNQSQTPVLFYAVCFIIYSLGIVDMISMSLATIFVLGRYVHAWVHLGSNRIPLRFSSFLVSCFALIGLVIYSLFAFL